MDSKNSFLSNISTTIFAQIFILVVSVIVSFILPKLISVEAYSMWQVFVFYSSYTGIFLLGINDGFIIRNAGKKYKDYKFDELSMEFIQIIAFQIFLASSLIIIILLFIHDRQDIYICLVLYMIFQNLFAFIGGIHQAVNNNKLYSVACIVERVFFIILLFLSFIFNNKIYILYIISNLISVLVSLLYIIRKTKLNFNFSINLWNEALVNMILNFKSGIKIMIANFSGTLIIGIGRLLIDQNWDVITFGKVSLAISILQLFLTFIIKASIVVFPALKQFTKKKAHNTLEILYFAITIIGPLILLLYFPIKEIINNWLPNYSDSMNYLTFILPISIYDSKMNLIYNTYFKIYRLENRIMTYNLISFFLCLSCGLLSVLFNPSINILLLIILISIIFREKISSNYVLDKLQINKKMSYFEMIYTFLFVMLAINCNSLVALCILAIVYIIFVLSYRNKIKSLLIIALKKYKK